MLLLDTHTLLWLARSDSPLGQRAERSIEAARTRRELAVAAITFWEIAMLASKGRVSDSASQLRTQTLEFGIQELVLDGAIAIASVALKQFHPDPADRILVATALQLGAQLVTADHKILKWRGGGLRTLDASR